MCSTVLVEEHKKVSFHKNILMKLNIL